MLESGEFNTQYLCSLRFKPIERWSGRWQLNVSFIVIELIEENVARYIAIVGSLILNSRFGRLTSLYNLKVSAPIKLTEWENQHTVCAYFTLLGERMA